MFTSKLLSKKTGIILSKVLVGPMAVYLGRDEVGRKEAFARERKETVEENTNRGTTTAVKTKY